MKPNRLYNKHNHSLLDNAIKFMSSFTTISPAAVLSNTFELSLHFWFHSRLFLSTSYFHSQHQPIISNTLITSSCEFAIMACLNGFHILPFMSPLSTYCRLSIGCCFSSDNTHFFEGIRFLTIKNSLISFVFSSISSYPISQRPWIRLIKRSPFFTKTRTTRESPPMEGYIVTSTIHYLGKILDTCLKRVFIGCDL